MSASVHTHTGISLNNAFLCVLAHLTRKWHLRLLKTELLENAFQGEYIQKRCLQCFHLDGLKQEIFENDNIDGMDVLLFDIMSWKTQTDTDDRMMNREAKNV